MLILLLILALIWLPDARLADDDKVNATVRWKVFRVSKEDEILEEGLWDGQ